MGVDGVDRVSETPSMAATGRDAETPGTLSGEVTPGRLVSGIPTEGAIGTVGPPGMFAVTMPLPVKEADEVDAVSETAAKTPLLLPKIWSAGLPTSLGNPLPVAAVEPRVRDERRFVAPRSGIPRPALARVDPKVPALATTFDAAERSGIPSRLEDVSPVSALPVS